MPSVEGRRATKGWQWRGKGCKVQGEDVQLSRIMEGEGEKNGRLTETRKERAIKVK